MKSFLFTTPSRLGIWIESKLSAKFHLECTISPQKITDHLSIKNPFALLVFIDSAELSFDELKSTSNQFQSAYVIILDATGGFASSIIQNHSDLNISDYINEAITDVRMKDCINTYKNRISQISTNRLYGNYIILNDKNERTFVSLNDINFIEGFGAYTKVHTDQKVFVVSKTLQRFLDMLPDFFVRTHRSYAVHMQHVKYLTNGNTLVMKNGCETKVSRLGIQILMSKMGLAS